MAAGWIFRLDADVYLGTWGSVSRALSAVHSSPATAKSLGSRRRVFSTWLGWSCNRRGSYPRPWIRLGSVGVTEEAMDCCFMASVRLRRCSACGICAPSTRGKRGSPWCPKFYSSSGHRHRHHGGRRSSQTSLGRVSAPQTVFLAQAVLALLCSLVRTGGGSISRLSGLTSLSTSKAIRRRAVRLGFRRFLSQLYGAFGTYPHFPFPAHGDSQQRSQL